MAQETPQMGLTKWNLVTDPFSHTQLAANLDLIDAHDHTSTKGVQIPAGGLADLSVATAKVQDSAVTAAKIGTGAVIAAKLGTGSVTNAKLGDESVTRAKLSDALIQTARVTTGSVATTTSVEITVTFDTPFADTNYTAVVSMLQGTASTALSLTINRIKTKAVDTIVVVVTNQNASVAKTGSLEVLAIHD